MNIQIKSDAANGQGSNKSGLKPRGLNREKTKNPNETSLQGTTENPALYARVISPADVQSGRVIAQLSNSETSQPLSSQLNNEINPTMVNKQVSGGDRQVI